MYQRRWSLAIALVMAVGLSANPIGLVTLAAQKKDDKKQDEAQKKEVQSVVKIVDDAAAWQAGPNDLSLAWVREDVLKAQGNKEYVPFIVTIDPAKVTGGTVAFYWRVVSKDAPVATAPAETATTGKKDDKKDK